jgi:TonB-linked SusC/RagA family outer membrane protein
MSIRILLLCSFLSLYSLLNAQNNKNYTVTGTIKDISGEPVIGASIVVKDSDPVKGTISDLDGNFSISLSDNETLVISYLGYLTHEVNVSGSQSSINIVLKEDAQLLDEIVVVGYGIQKRSSLTGSVETINNKDILKIPTVNLDEALSGQIAGLQVRSLSGDPSSAREANVRIRGISQPPLLVIDGVPRFGENTGDGEMRLSDINPDDVESISVLKDAAAAAVYGARAANGVILVTTKRSKGDEKIRVNYRGQFNLQEATQLPEFLDSYEFAQLYNKAVENTGTGTYKSYTAEELEMIRNQTNKNVYANENLFDHLNKYGHSTIHSLNVSGGRESIKYYISGAYTNTKGLYSGIGRDRYNYSVKLDAVLLKGLTFTVDVLGNTSANKNTSYTTLDAAYSFSPIQPLRFENGLLASINSGNPLIAVDGLGGYTQDKTNMNTLTARLNYEIPALKGLSVYARTTIDKNNTSRKIFSNPVILYLYEPDTPEVYRADPNTVYPTAKISLTERNQFTDKKLLEAGVNYSGNFKKHSVTGLLVTSYEDWSNRYLQGINENMPGTFPEQIGNTTGKISGNESKNERASLIGRATYGFDSRYFLETSFRVDGSTSFHPDHRWGFFPTVSASWVVSNESFFMQWKQNVLSNLKLRGSFGILGQDSNVPYYSYLNNYIYTLRQGYEIGDLLQPGLIMDVGYYPNPELTWEKSRDYNIAADIGLWDNKIGITYEYFQRYRSDFLANAPSYLYPPSTGTDSNLPYMNLGRIKAWGWDLTLTHRNTMNKFKYDFMFTISKSDDIIKDYGDESSLPESQRRAGKPSRVTWMYEATGLFQTQDEIDEHAIQGDSDNSALAPGDIKYVDKNEDNYITKEDMIAVKNSSYPDMAYSFKVGFEYKGFFFNSIFQGVDGCNMRLPDTYTLENNSLQRFQTYHRDESWEPGRLDANYPRIKFTTSNDNNRKESTFWIRKANYIRLKSVSFGYSIPPASLKKMRLTSLSIALQGSNLYTWSSLKEMDPESLRGYPIQRSYGVTVNFGF